MSVVTDSPSAEKTVRLDDVSDTSLNGEGEGSDSNCEISSEPTRPTPTTATEIGDFTGIVAEREYLRRGCRDNKGPEQTKESGGMRVSRDEKMRLI